MGQRPVLTAVKAMEDAPQHKLNIMKGKRFRVKLKWDSPHDLDASALACHLGSGGLAKISDEKDMLSTFNPNLPLADGTSSTRPVGNKRPFQTIDGALHHSGDARTGILADVDEIITIDPSLLHPSVCQIPIFVTIYDEKNLGLKFKDVKSAAIIIEDDAGKVLCEFELSAQFGGYSAVQMGTLILDPNQGWSYSAGATGFDGDINTILDFFWE